MIYTEYDKELRQTVFAALRRAPMTAQQVAEFVGWSRDNVQPRITELKLAGMIYDTGEKRRNNSGRGATIWARQDTHPDRRMVQAQLL